MSVSSKGALLLGLSGEKNNQSVIRRVSHVRHVLVSSQGLLWICAIQRTWGEVGEAPRG